MESLRRFIKRVGLFFKPKKRGGVSSQFQQRANELNSSVLYSTRRGVTDYKYFDDHQIIVSLTTFGVRLSQVYLTIESIMQQTKLANRIVLWLSKEQEGEMLPQALINQMERGLEIYYCDDIRSYTKIIPSLKMFPKDAIITIDDDVIYGVLTLESLINSYLENQDYIYFNRGRRVVLDGNNVKRYSKWSHNIRDNKPHVLNFPTGVGGVLYPPNIFSEEVLNEEVFMAECKYADDIWLYAMALLNNKRSRRSKAMMISPAGGFVDNSLVQEVSLKSINVAGSMNNEQFQAIFKRYNLFGVLTSE